MNIKLKTTELQSMVNKSIKCVSNNKLIPLTSLMSIKVQDNCLTLTTTDATNYFYVSSTSKIDSEDFEVSVLADLFTHLVQKTTSDEITLEIEGNLVKVKGNGTYTMELPLDENGNPIKFPVKLKNDDFRTLLGTIKVSTIKTLLAVNKPSLADSMEFPALTCYYCGDSVITSDRKQICRTNIKMFDEPMLITPALMELLGSFEEENIEVTAEEDSANVVFSTSTAIVFAPITSGVDTFPVDSINTLADQSFSSTCVLPKSAVLNVLDRLSLFVAPYDKKQIYLTFTREGLMLSSMKSSGQELIPYINSENFMDYTCCINIDMLKAQISSQDCDNITLSYGSDVAVKLSNKNITQIIALMQDDRTEA